MPPQVKDILISPLTRLLLEENGMSDRKLGISMYEGWQEIARLGGYDDSRTPAREAYEDGYYKLQKD